MDIERLASLESNLGALVTVYLDPSTGPASTVLGELAKPVRAAADRAGHDAAMSIRADLARLDGLTTRFDTDPAAGWFVALADHAGIEEIRPLGSPVENLAVVGRRPYIRPLRALPRALRALVAVVERPKVGLFASDDGLVEISTLESELGKENFGGFRGYDEPRATRRFEEESVKTWREAAAVALHAHQDRPFDLVIVAGHQHDLNHFGEQLHPYLRSLPTFQQVVDPHTITSPQLLERVRAAEPEVRRRQDEEALDAVLDGAYAGTHVARGTRAVLDAVNVGAVDRLVVSGPFSKDGVICPGCGWLARSGEMCPSCADGVEHVHDVIASAIEATVRQGGRATQVGVASALDAEGVAATLRFAVGPVVAEPR